MPDSINATGNKLAAAAGKMAAKAVLSAIAERDAPKEVKKPVSVDPVKKLLEVAASQVGLKEIPVKSNWGEHVQKYLKAVKLNFAAPWCMAFVHWCIADVVKALLLPQTKVHNSGHVLTVWSKTDKSLRIPADQIRPGDIFILVFPSGSGHTGIIEKVLPGGKYQAIEGNSNKTGSRDGIEVCRPKIRDIKDARGFLRPF